MKRLYLGFAIVAFVVNCIPPKGWKNSSYIYNNRTRLSSSSQNVRVLLYAGRPISIKIDGKYLFRRDKGASLRGRGTLLPKSPGELITKKNIFTLKGKSYRGRLKVYAKKGRAQYVNIVSLSDYLLSVVGHEMSPTWPLEALKAQAVVARTYLVTRLDKKKNRLYDVSATTNNQVYGGILKKPKRVIKAVSSTRGELVLYRSRVAEVFFYSSCGGKTASSLETWKRELAYLQGKKSTYCRLAPVYKWKVKVPTSSFAKKLHVASIVGLKVIKRSNSGRAKTIIIKTNQGIKKISGKKFRFMMGATKIKSTLFDLRLTGSTIAVSGRGYGHGVGLCQWGSRFMAEKKKASYKSIIRHYFPGTRVRKNFGRIII